MLSICQLIPSVSRPRGPIFTLALLWTVFIGACGPAEEAEPVSQLHEPIQGGVAESGFPGVGEVHVGAGTFCTGTLIGPTTILTAAHCLDSTLNFEAGGAFHAVNAHTQHPSLDLAVLHTDPVLVTALNISEGGLPGVGTICTAVGFGIHNEADGSVSSQAKRSCTEQVASADPSTIAVNMVSGIADRGDSGGPLLCSGRISAVVRDHTDGSFPLHTHENYTTVDAPWINRSAALWTLQDMPNLRGKDFWVAGWTLADFWSEYLALLRSGYSLIALKSYDLGGAQIRVDANWRLTNPGQYAVHGWTASDFWSEYLRVYSLGYRLVDLIAYDIGGGQIRFDAFFNPDGSSQYAIHGWTGVDFLNEYRRVYGLGYRMTAFAIYDIGGGQLRYDAFFTASTTPQVLTQGWTLADFWNEHQDNQRLGYSLKALKAYDIGHGQIRYDAIWNKP